MRHQAAHAEKQIEVQIGPHSARPNWRVMRVTYIVGPEHDARVTAALDALFGPPPVQKSGVAQIGSTHQPLGGESTEPEGAR